MFRCASLSFCATATFSAAILEGLIKRIEVPFELSPERQSMRFVGYSVNHR